MRCILALYAFIMQALRGAKEEVKPIGVYFLFKTTYSSSLVVFLTKILMRVLAMALGPKSAF